MSADLFSTCTECDAATQRPHFVFRNGCPGCKARAIARGPDFHRCSQAGKQDREYRTLLAAAGVTHDAVVQARATDKERTAA